MKLRRRTIIPIAAVPLLLIVLLALVPLLFRGRIEAALQTQLEKSVAAQVTWSGAGMSLLRDFPNATLTVHDLAVVGVDAFAGDTLLSLERLRTELDLGSVWRAVFGDGAIDVRGIAVERPSVRLVRLEDGRASWDIVKPREVSADSERDPMDVTLRSLTIRDGRLLIDDRAAGLSGSVSALEHTLSGDFRQSRFVIRSRTSADTVSLRFGGVPWLSRAAVGIDADIDADRVERRYTLRDNVVRVNALELRSEGSLALGTDSSAVDVSFSAPGTAFADILSLVPAIYTQSFATLRTAGTLSMNGRVHGGVGNGAFPAFEIRARVEDGSFQYPDLPLPARDIAFDLNVVNGGGAADSTVIRLDGMRVVLGSDPIEGSFALRTPVSDPDVDVRLVGRLELENVGRTMKLEGMEELRGTLVADAAMRARQSDVEARRFERVTASGSVEATDVAVRFGVTEAAAANIDAPDDDATDAVAPVAGGTTRAGRDVRIDHALLRLTPQHAELADLRARSGSSDVAMTGTLDNLLGYALGRDVLRGSARITSSNVNLDEWRSDDEASALPVPANVDVDVRADIARLTLGTLEMRNATGALHIRERRATLSDFRMDMLGGSMAVSGYYETLEAVPPRFDVALRVSDFEVPAAFAGLATMRALAPVAAYAEGRMSADLELAGALGPDLAPVLDVLTGDGALETHDIVIRDFPAFDRLAERLSIDQLRDPALRDLESSFAIHDGRLHVRPFDVGVGPLAMTVTGSNGFDQTLDYELMLRMPRALMGADANRVLTSLASQSQRAGLDLQAAETVGVGVRLTGDVRDPDLGLDLRDVAGSTAARIEQALRDRAAGGVESVEQRVDSAAEAARQRAEAEAARIVAEAEAAAAGIRAQAQELAERVRQEGAARADSLVANAGSPAARIAARAAADRLRQESDAQADRILRDADARAEALVEEARRRAETVRSEGV
jgi:hypothetical protein